MRPLEIALVALLAATLLTRLIPPARRPRWTHALAWGALAVLAMHAMVEGIRWQLYPAYVLALALALTALRRARDAERLRNRRELWRIAGVLGALLMVALGTLLAVGFPIFHYPPPSGPYGVGTTRLAFVDSARTDPFAPTPERPRELLASVWYPADVPAGAPRAPFWPRDTSAAAAIGLPAFMFTHLALVPAHASPDAPVAGAKERWPVIVYSHGLNSTPWQNVVQMEELASHGFVVVSLGHAYDASRLTFPDGHVALDNSRTRAPQPSPRAQEEAMRLAALVDSTGHPDSVRSVWRRTEERFASVGVYIMPSVEVWYDDTRFLMDRLTAIDAGTDGAVIERIMSRYLLASFQQYLLGEAQPLLAAPTPPEELSDATLTVVKPAAPRPPTSP